MRNDNGSEHRNGSKFTDSIIKIVAILFMLAFIGVMIFLVIVIILRNNSINAVISLNQSRHMTSTVVSAIEAVTSNEFHLLV